VKLIEPETAARLVDDFVATFEPDALFFRNGKDDSYNPVLGTTFERGAAIVDSRSAGILVVGDED
jgi:hypothetical protein